MKARTLLILLFIVLVNDLTAQRKIILRNGLKRIVVKPGKVIGVTQVGEPYHYSNWKSVCSDCYLDSCMDSLYAGRKYFDSTFFYYRDCRDTICINNIWFLDSIKGNKIVLRQLSGDSTKYRLDTVNVDDYDRYERRMRKQNEEPLFVEVDSSTGEPDTVNYSYIVLVATGYDRKTISLDSIASLSFSRAESCLTFDLSVPLFTLVAAIGAPIIAADKKQFGGKFGWPVFIAGEAIAGWLSTSMVRNVNSLKVRRYNLNEWEAKTR